MAELATTIQKKWGAQAVRQGNEVATAASFSPLPTSFSRLDRLLEGGLLPGQISELQGIQTSGVATLALRSVASAQEQEERVIYLDPTSAFSPKYAAQCGVRLQDLVIVRPTKLTEGLEIASDLVNRYSAGLFVFGHTASEMDDEGRAALRRLVNSVRRSTCAFVVLNRAPTADASPFHPYTATRLQLRRVRWLERWGVIGGYLVKVTLLKKNGTECNRSLTLRFDLP